MVLINNRGKGRAAEVLRSKLSAEDRISVLSGLFSIYAFEALQQELSAVQQVRFLLTNVQVAGFRPTDVAVAEPLRVNGTPFETLLRNKLTQSAVARKCAEWVQSKVEVRQLNASTAEAWFLADKGSAAFAMRGAPFTAEALGMVPSKNLSMISADEGTVVAEFVEQFNELWESPEYSSDLKDELLAKLQELYAGNTPQSIYLLTLHSIFQDFLQEADADRIIKKDTGFYDSAVWNKLYKFQRDGVLGAIEKLERYNGCIIADSVGLGKTFEALAVIKYYELRNDRVLVLAPKRLRENWTIYSQNDRRNILLVDRFNYDVLHHTDLNRTSGYTGSINLATINWENYDLVVIDESHNFRNNPPVKDRITRYQRLMQDVFQKGVKTKVLMLSATPVNTKMTDLRNQVLFATEGRDDALAAAGIRSVDQTLQRAQRQFNAWLDKPADSRNAKDLVGALGLDYVRLLDLLTIARSRKHIEKYYGTEEVGKFPTRLTPINIKADVDLHREYPALENVNKQIGLLHLAGYSPLAYVLPSKRVHYEKLYDQTVAGSESKIFKQSDRESSLIHLMRVNMLKRMESSIHSFSETVDALQGQVENLLEKISTYEADKGLSVSLDSFDDDDYEQLDFNDPLFDDAVVGTKIKVLLEDMDLIRWRQDLEEDAAELKQLLTSSREVTPIRDEKLHELKKIIKAKADGSANSGNRKLLVFTAFSDTAEYLYKHVKDWALDELGLHSAQVTGGGNQTTLPGCRKDTNSILINFSPRSKDRDKLGEINGPEIDVLIATDTISEGQNLQDCDTVVNYDIHWNPVRIIQRFGRVDRLGSTNDSVQLINFWPNIELDEYIQLEARVSGRMVLLDVSATGEENVLVEEEGGSMNDLEYRRHQLEQLQGQALDLEDLSGGLSITDLTLSDFRMDISSQTETIKDSLASKPLGLHAVTRIDQKLASDGMEPGAIFVLKNTGAGATPSGSYPLAPFYLAYVSDAGQMMKHPEEPKLALDLLRTHALSNADTENTLAVFNKMTRNGLDMSHYQDLLATAINSLSGTSQEEKVASIFSRGATQIGSAAPTIGLQDFEVITWLALLPPVESTKS